MYIRLRGWGLHEFRSGLTVTAAYADCIGSGSQIVTREGSASTRDIAMICIWVYSL